MLGNEMLRLQRLAASSDWDVSPITLLEVAMRLRLIMHRVGEDSFTIWVKNQIRKLEPHVFEGKQKGVEHTRLTVELHFPAWEGAPWDEALEARANCAYAAASSHSGVARSRISTAQRYITPINKTADRVTNFFTKRIDNA